jgi:hypothetical protein
MTLRSRTSTAVFSFRQDVHEDDIYERLREAAASHLLRYREHQAGKGSIYIRIGDDIKIRESPESATFPRMFSSSARRI